MPRGVRTPKPATEAATVHDRIKAAEKALLSGAAERVVVSEADLERIAVLIAAEGKTKGQLLKAAVRLGLDVLSINPKSDPSPHRKAHVEAGSHDRLEEEASDIPPPGIPASLIEQGFVLRRAGGRRLDHDVSGSPPEPPPEGAVNASGMPSTTGAYHENV